jgi:hypothetical protein
MAESALNMAREKSSPQHRFVMPTNQKNEGTLLKTSTGKVGSNKRYSHIVEF